MSAAKDSGRKYRVQVVARACGGRADLFFFYSSSFLPQSPSLTSEDVTKNLEKFLLGNVRKSLSTSDKQWNCSQSG